MRSLGYLCSARFVGNMYDSRSGHPVMGIALLCVAGMACTISFLTNFWMLALLIFGMGVGGAFVDLGGNILLVRVFRERSGPVMNGLHFSFGTGAFAAPLLVAFALWTMQSTVHAYWMIGLISAPIALWLIRIPSPALPRSTSDDGQAGSSASMLLAYIVAFFFLYGGAEISFGGWIHTYGVKQNGMDDAQAAYLTSGFWGAFTLGRLIAIPLALRFRPGTLLKVQVAGCVATLAVLFFGSKSIMLTWCCTLLVGLCMSSIFPLMLTHLERFTAGSGRLTSWFFVGASSGSMCIPWIIGQFIDDLGPQVFVGIVLCCMLLGGGILGFGVRSPGVRESGSPGVG